MLDNRGFTQYHKGVKQEVIIAIAAGFLIGAGVAFGIVQLSSTMKENPGSPPTAKIAAGVSGQPQHTPTIIAGTSQLDVSEPADETVVTNKTIKVSGKTQPDNTVVVETEEDTQAKQAGADGTFTISVALSEGNNPITISSYNDKGEEQTKTVSVFYTSETL